jgi:methylthioribose-1-phosphate isomerase
VTPHRYVSAIITEQGIVRDPFQANLASLFEPRLGKNKGGPRGRS